MFSDPNFEHYNFEQIPLGGDIFVVSDKWLKPYENMMNDFLSGKEYEHIGYVSYFSARTISKEAMEMSFFANIFDRFHEITVVLPKSQFVICIGSRHCDEKPRIFVKDEWIKHIHLTNYSVFGYIDAINVKKALLAGELNSSHFLSLRKEIDLLAEKNPAISFISFGDSLIIKSNWTVGLFDSETKYTYSPESLITLIKEISTIYKSVLKLNIYGILTQGTNDFYGSSLLHISSSQNHICLNSLGIPFERLLSIEDAARGSIREKRHPAHELYLDEEFFNSLNISHDFREKGLKKFPYLSRMATIQKYYFPTSFSEISENLNG